MSFIAFRGLFYAGLKIGFSRKLTRKPAHLKKVFSVRTGQTYHFANPGFYTNPVLTHLLTAPTTSPQWIHQDGLQRVNSPAPVKDMRHPRNDSHSVDLAVAFHPSPCL